MILYRTGNLLVDNAEVLVNTVNCKGVMGAGLAKQFRTKFPEIIVPYQIYCRDRATPGCILPTPTLNSKMVLNAFTKDHWKGKSELPWVTECAFRISKYLEDAPQYKSIAIAPMGCGLGGLNWYDVKPIIVAHMEAVCRLRNDLNVRIYEP